MKILILGGTRFLGRHIVHEAVRRGFDVTVFNRGNNTSILPDTEILLGDRNGSLDILQKRKWDAVIDTCGFVPQTVSRAAKVLGDNIKHYTYISSISVYKDWIPLNITEDYPVQTISAEEVAEVTKDATGPVYEHYGALKALCEQEAEQHMPGKVLTVRVGQIVGSFDYTDRLSYWIQRVAQGGRILCPGNPDRRIQFIDARDVSRWILTMAEQQKTGTYNLTGPYSLTMQQLLETCQLITKSDAEFVWVQEEFLVAHDIIPWIQLPFWLPENHPFPGELEPWKGSFHINITKALMHGLTFRPLEDTVHAVWEWEQLRNDEERKTGLSYEQEQELLHVWDNMKTH